MKSESNFKPGITFGASYMNNNTTDNSKQEDDFDFEFEFLDLDEALSNKKSIAEKDEENTIILDKVQVLKNFRYLLDKSNFKIGDVEEESGNTKGYVSRLESPGNTSFPNLNFLTHVAKKFNVSMDDLLFGRLDRLMPSEEFLICFTNKLVVDTKQEKLEWNKISNLDKSDYGKYQTADLSNISLRKMALDNINITTKVNGESVRIYGMAYRAFLPDDTNSVYIAYVDMQNTEVAVKHADYYELFLEDKEGEIIQLCDLVEVNPTVKMAMKKLYDAVEDATSHVRIGEKAKSIISNYMNL